MKRDIYYKINHGLKTQDLKDYHKNTQRNTKNINNPFKAYLYIRYAVYECANDKQTS